MTIIYVARPIDSYDGASASAIAETVRGALRSAGVGMYLPIGAWELPLNKPVTGQVQDVNEYALSRCDGLIAILPADTRRPIGVPREIGVAVASGKPVVVVGEELNGRWALGDLPRYGVSDASLGAATQKLLDLVKERKRWSETSGIDDSIGLPVKLTRGARLPERGHAGDAGLDLAYAGKTPMYIEGGDTVDIPTGVYIEWPQDTWGMIIGRSSTLRNKGLLVNMAVIDPGYRGELFVVVRNLLDIEYELGPQERLAQIVPLPALNYLKPVQVEKIEESKDGRNGNGFGSTG